MKTLSHTSKPQKITFCGPYITLESIINSFSIKGKDHKNVNEGYQKEFGEQLLLTQTAYKSESFRFCTFMPSKWLPIEMDIKSKKI